MKQQTRQHKTKRRTSHQPNNTSSENIRICNIERGLPTVQDALQIVEAEILAAKAGKWNCLKLIHGYGSSGKGGRIKNALPGFLDTQMRKGNIRDYIKGENFSIFDPITQKALLKYPDLSSDADCQQCNHGITIVLL